MNSFQPSVIRQISFGARAFVRRNPLLYRNVLRFRGTEMSFFVSRETDLLIAGYGGSANTYATDAVLHGNPNINLAHHLHAVAQPATAAQLGTPCLVLIRHPVDAISSLTTRGGLTFSIDGLGWALKEYQGYYDAVVRYRDSFVACNFKDVVEDFGAVIQKLNQRYKTSFIVPENGSSVSKTIIETHKVRGSRRVCALEDVQKMLMSSALEKVRVQAEQSYEEFCALTQTRVWKDPARPPVARRPILAE